MRKLILVILFQLLRSTSLIAQQPVQLPEVQQMMPRKSDENPQFYDTSVHRISWGKIVLREIDFTLPENRVLDSTVDWYGEPFTFTEIIFKALKTKNLDVSSLVNDSSLQFAKLSAKTYRKIIDSLDKARFNKIITLEQVVFDWQKSRMITRMLVFAPAAKVGDNEYKPVFWISYPSIRNELGKYKIVASKDGKMKLIDFFERRLFKSKIIRTWPLRHD